MTHKRLPLGIVAVTLLVVLATIGLVNGLWSKNLIVNGIVTTGDLNVDFTNVSNGDPSGAIDACTNPFNPNPCGSYVHKDVGRLACDIDTVDHQVIHFAVFNAYPSYQADCEVHFANTGSIPFNVIGFGIDPDASLTNCTVATQTSQALTIHCDQLTISYVDNVGTQIDPGTEVSSSLLIHVEQKAAQNTCTGTTTLFPLTPPNVHVTETCTNDPLVTY